MEVGGKQRPREESFLRRAVLLRFVFAISTLDVAAVSGAHHTRVIVDIGWLCGCYLHLLLVLRHPSGGHVRKARSHPLTHSHSLADVAAV